MRTLLVSLASALSLVATAAVAHPPVVQPPTSFATGVPGPEGIAFGRDGSLYVGTEGGDIRRIAPDGTHVVVASTGDRLAGITVGKDGTIFACAFNADRVWGARLIR
jgi:hypothetical protein